MSVSRAYIANTPFDQFDPNAQSDPSVAWAVYDGLSFRTWATRGPSLQAFHQVRAQGKLYEYVLGHWEERACKVYPAPQVCGDCGVSTMEAYTRYDYNTRSYVVPDPNDLRNRGEWIFRKAGRTKLAEPLELLWACKACRA